MRGYILDPTLVGMTAGTRIVLEVVSSEPLQGRVLAEGADSRPFTGWLGLMEALRQVLGSKQTEQLELRDDH
jgi:hypothetical protein